MKPWGPLVEAHAFLTRIPVGRAAAGAPNLARAAACFPLVGLTVGLIAALVRWSLDPVGPLVATVAACAVVPLVTGGFHEDGLADTFDALGPLDRARRLEVMRDSRIGTFGALALVFSVAIRVAVLAPMGTRDACALLIAGHVLGRWSTLPLATWCRPARADGLGAATVRVGLAALSVGTVFALVCAIPALMLVSSLSAALGTAVALAVTGLTALWWTRAFGGVTGDTYGATNQLTEIAVIAAGAAPL